MVRVVGLGSRVKGLSYLRMPRLGSDEERRPSVLRHLVFKAHRLVHLSIPGSRIIKKRKKSAARASSDST